MSSPRPLSDAPTSEVLISSKGITNFLGPLLSRSNISGVKVETLEDGRRRVVAQTTRERLSEALQNIGFEIIHGVPEQTAPSLTTMVQ